MGTLTDAKRPGSKLLVVGASVVTVLIHGGIVAGVWLGRARAESERQPLLGNVVDVQAVRFGKPRDLSFLPHKEVAPRPRPKPQIALTENEHALPKLKDPNKPEEKPKPEEDLLKKTHTDLFKDLPPADDETSTGSAAPEGDPNGLKGGTATVGKGPIYLQHLVAAVQNAWVVPTTINDKDLARLQGIVFVKIDASGKIVELKLQSPSGNDRFDATLMDAFGTLKQFEPPTSDVKEMLGEGVALRFKYERAH